MAKIQCPGCGKIEDVDLRGRFLATCDSCGQQFVVSIIGQKVTEGSNIVCPQCGAAHKSTLVSSQDIRIICKSCGYNFKELTNR